MKGVALIENLDCIVSRPSSRNDQKAMSVGGCSGQSVKGALASVGFFEQTATELYDGADSIVDEALGDAHESVLFFAAPLNLDGDG